MNMNQQLATGFLALVIVVSIAFMPVSAEEKNAPAPAAAPRAQGTAVASLNTTENPQDQVRDLTYN